MAAETSPNIFNDESAPVELGVGKNMVRAIRFWGRAAKVLADRTDPSRPRLPGNIPSENGRALFDENYGWDPYLELPGSLWLLHWWMLSAPCMLPVWWLTFNEFTPLEFSEEELLNYLVERLNTSSLSAIPTPSSIKKDVSCLIRMYAAGGVAGPSIDDVIDCPFRDLGLIEHVWDDHKRLRFTLGGRATLPSHIVAYACIDYLAKAGSGSRSITVGRLTQDAGGPGRVFRITEDAIATAIQAHSLLQDTIAISSVAGVTQLIVRDLASDLDVLARQIIETYYQQSGGLRYVPIQRRRDEAMQAGQW
jgi:hypothetical protein